MNINKKTIILQGAGLLMLAGIAGGCSNVEEGFHVADRSNLKLTLSPSNNQAGETVSEKNLSVIQAVNGMDTVYVDCPANWKVEVINDERPDSHTEWTLYVSEPQENSKGRFFTYISTANIRQEQRNWPNAIKVYVEGHDGEQLVPAYLSVRQHPCVLQLDKDSFEIFPAAGGSGTITVTSNDPQWSVRSGVESTPLLPNGWIEIERTGDKVHFTVLANRGTSVRSGSLQFLDGSGKVVADVNITQSESSVIFDAAIVGGSDLISQYGATLGVNVLSDGRWKVESAQGGDGGWLYVEGLGETLDATNNLPGGAGRQIGVLVAPNESEYSREATLAFSRIDDAATESTGGVAPILIRIVQAGTQQPAFSVIWVGDDYNQHNLEIFGRYFTDSAVTESGFEITNVTKGTGPVDIPNLTGIQGESTYSGYIHVMLDYRENYGGLTYEAANEYLIRPYVIVAGVKKYGSTHYPFTAPGKKPGNSDQSKPDVE